MKLTLLSAMLMTAVVGITSANAADYKKLLLPPMQLIRGLAVGCHVTWITFCVISPGLRVLLENPRTPKHIQKREGYSAIKALAAVNNAIIQLMVYGVPSLNRG
ncbi:TPA: hypothetical protein O7M76_001256 [Escherichia coli]|nr:hypothetical protein [Escherichia coli]